MRRSRRGLLIAAFAAAMPAARADGTTALAPWAGASEAPPVELLRLDGSPLTLHQLRGKVVLVNFWATWCEPCTAEMPSLQQLRDTFGAQRFDVLGVNHKEGEARIAAFLARAGITFPVVRDTDGAVARAWNARVFPASYVVDREGRIRYAATGAADWTDPRIVSTIRALLEPQPLR